MSQAGNVTDARGPALSAGSQLASTGTVVFSNSNGITFGMSNSSVVTASYTVPTAPLTLSEYRPLGANAVNNGNGLGNNTIDVQYFDLNNYVSAYRVNFYISNTVNSPGAGASFTNSGTWQYSFALYTRGAGASSTALQSFLSRSCSSSFSVSYTAISTLLSYGFPYGISNSTAVSTSQFSTTVTASSDAATYGNTYLNGARVLAFPISSTLSPGRYWMATAQSTTTAANSGAVGPKYFQRSADFEPTVFLKPAMGISSFNTQIRGSYTVTSAAFPGTIGFSDLAPGSPNPIYFNFSGFTTGDNTL